MGRQNGRGTAGNMMGKRIQLTLFVAKEAGRAIETVRHTFNPVQAALIPAHVTLCREDELTDLEMVVDNLSRLSFGPITLQLGRAERSAEGKGVLIPAVGGMDAFDGLRRHILAGITDNPRRLSAHITLMHPRNSTCTDALFQQIQDYVFPETITFRTVSLIGQEDLTAKWQVLKEFDL